MPMIRETGKDRWKRVPKDYFKKPDRLQRRKLQFSALAFVLALAWWAVGVNWTGAKSGSDLNSLRANHGELARVHTAWANKCDACHVPFAPIDGRPLLSLHATPESRKAGDRLCSSCHAGTEHHRTMIASEVKGCAECHRDHQGRDFSLVRLNDNECTNCHANLTAHTVNKPAAERIYGNASAFDIKDHPAFQPSAATYVKDKPPVDKSRLKFNHAQHMTPGIVKKPGETPYTVARIPVESERNRYLGGGKMNDPVKLDCASCHQLDASEVQGSKNPAVASTSLPSRNPGKYYLPVNYETQCRACHVLTFDPRMPDREVPHGVQPDVVIASLNQIYAADILAADPEALKVFVPSSRIPGKSPVEATLLKRRDDSIQAAIKFLFPTQPPEPSPPSFDPKAVRNSNNPMIGDVTPISRMSTDPKDVRNSNNCAECHYIQDEKGIPTHVEPTKVPEVWYQHALFNHSAHRAVSCVDCHARSYPMIDGKANPEASSVATDVLIPGLDNCVKCHAPARSGNAWFGSSSSSEPTGGVAFDCTECHRYHNGDQVLQGYGSSLQDADHVRSIGEFLRGTGGKPLKKSAGLVDRTN